MSEVAPESGEDKIGREVRWHGKGEGGGEGEKGCARRGRGRGRGRKGGEGRKTYRKARVGETDNTPSRWVAYLRVHGVAPGVQ